MTAPYIAHGIVTTTVLEKEAATAMKQASEQSMNRRPGSQVLRDGINVCDVFAGCPYTALNCLRHVGGTYPRTLLRVPRPAIDNLKTADDICAPKSDVAILRATKDAMDPQRLPLCRRPRPADTVRFGSLSTSAARQ